MKMTLQSIADALGLSKVTVSVVLNGRAAQYGIRHFCWVAVNPKESDNIALSREVIAALPGFLDKPTVLGIGEIRLNKNTLNELVIFHEQMEMAIKLRQLVLIHTPHLRDNSRARS